MFWLPTTATRNILDVPLPSAGKTQVERETREGPKREHNTALQTVDLSSFR